VSDFANLGGETRLGVGHHLPGGLGHGGSLGLVAQNFGYPRLNVGSVPGQRNIGFSGLVQIGPGLQVSRVGLEQNSAAADGFAVALATLSPAERAETSPN